MSRTTTTGWHRRIGTNVYVNHAAKYAHADITIRHLGKGAWAVLVGGELASTRPTFRDAKVLAVSHTNESAL